MKRLFILAVSGLAFPLVAQQLDVKLGAWEMTNKLSNLAKPMVDKECVTKADLQQFARCPEKDDDNGCRPVGTAKLTGKKWSSSLRCSDGSQVQAEFVAESPERITGSIVRSGAKAGPNIRIDISGRWLGASCAGIR